MLNGIRINGVRNGRQYIDQVNLNAGGVAFFNGNAKEVDGEREARLWIEAIINDTEPSVKPEEAYVVTRILEGIYESAKTGKPYYFN